MRVSRSCGVATCVDTGEIGTPGAAAATAGNSGCGKTGSVSTGGATAFPGMAGSVAVAAGKTVAGGATVAKVAAWASSFGQTRHRSPVGSIRGQRGQRNPAQPASNSAQAIASGTRKRRR